MPPFDQQMTPAQARVVDPVLSTHAVGYSHPDRVGRLLFPVAQITARGMRVVRFGKESFVEYDLARVPGADIPEVQFGYASDPIVVSQDSLAGKVPIELQDEAQIVMAPGVNLGREAVDTVMEIITLQEEREQAAIAQDPNNYGVNNRVALTGTDKWSDPTSDPARQMRTYKEAVRAKIGRYPNTLVVSPDTKIALASHDRIKEQFRYTSPDSITDEMLRQYFELERFGVGKSVSAADPEADFDDIWQNSGVLAYVSTGSNYRVPSYGYTYRLRGFPLVEQGYFRRRNRSWIYPMVDERSVNQTAAEAGFLIQNPA